MPSHSERQAFVAWTKTTIGRHCSPPWTKTTIGRHFLSPNRSKRPFLSPNRLKRPSKARFCAPNRSFRPRDLLFVTQSCKTSTRDRFAPRLAAGSPAAGPRSRQRGASRRGAALPTTGRLLPPPPSSNTPLRHVHLHPARQIHLLNHIPQQVDQAGNDKQSPHHGNALAGSRNSPRQHHCLPPAHSREQHP